MVEYLFENWNKGDNGKMKTVRIEIFEEFDMDLEVVSEAAIRKKLQEIGYGEFFFEIKGEVMEDGRVKDVEEEKNE